MKVVKCIECKHARWQTSGSGDVLPLKLGRCDAVIPPQTSYICIRPQAVPEKRGIWPNSSGSCAAFELVELRDAIPGQTDMGDIWEGAQ